VHAAWREAAPPHFVEQAPLLAEQLSSVPNSISIEGHTDSLPYANDKGYGN
jgi:flagellar motor protein MotB